MIDICTVVFEPEIPTLRLQAQSLDLYCRNIGIRNIYVVVNDDDNIAQTIDPAWWGDLASHVLVVPRTAFSVPWINNGWVTQQLWKMLAASMSYNTWTMVLDAKTVFVREADLDTMLDSQGRAAVGYLPVYPVFEPARRIVDDLFGIKIEQQIGPGGVPFLFHNDTVRFMIADVTLHTRQSFPRWFQDQGVLTEFMLYSGYVQHKYAQADCIINPANQLGLIINICHSQQSQFDHLLDRMRTENPLTVSVHREAWQRASESQQMAYKFFLIDRGILAVYDHA
jgi:hypothetical protein